MSEEPAAAKLCAFDGVWGRAIPHDRYVIK